MENAYGSTLLGQPVFNILHNGVTKHKYLHLFPAANIYICIHNGGDLTWTCLLMQILYESLSQKGQAGGWATVRAGSPVFSDITEMSLFS